MNSFNRNPIPIMNHHSCRKRWILFPLIGAAALFVFSLAVMLLWNGVLTSVVAVRSVSLWQAMGLLVLAKILFGGFHGPHRRPPWMRHGPGGESWCDLTPDERARLRDAMCQRFGDESRPPAAPGEAAAPKP